jgi:hypothetical protein
MSDQLWQVTVSFTETDDRTRADAIIELADERYHGWGQARRSPGDPNVPVVGKDLAAARALSDLGHQLVSAAASRIEDWESHSVQLDH